MQPELPGQGSSQPGSKGPQTLPRFHPTLGPSASAQSILDPINTTGWVAPTGSLPCKELQTLAKRAQKGDLPLTLSRPPRSINKASHFTKLGGSGTRTHFSHSTGLQTLQKISSNPASSLCYQDSQQRSSNAQKLRLSVCTDQNQGKQVFLGHHSQIKAMGQQLARPDGNYTFKGRDYPSFFLEPW